MIEAFTSLESSVQITISLLAFLLILIVMKKYPSLFERYINAKLPKTADDVAKENNPNNFEPFYFKKYFKAPRSDEKELEKVAFRWQKMISEMSTDQCFVLHSYFDSVAKNEDALITICLAIAKGKCDSKMHGFKAATLRKLGRYEEAKSSAELAIGITPENADAHYNLSLIYLHLGQTELAEAAAKKSVKFNREAFYPKLVGRFPGII